MEVHTTLTSNSQVTIPVDSGFVALTQDTEVSALSISGGALLTHNSTCLPGWTPAPGGTTSSFGASKCYKVFSQALSWQEAKRACASAVSRQEVSESIKQVGCAVVVNPANGSGTGRSIYSRAALEGGGQRTTSDLGQRHRTRLSCRCVMC